MQIDPAQHPGRQTYLLLTSLVIPRPIAWVTSLSETGVINLAPFSFFNAVNGEPPYIVLSVGRRSDGSPKDTARNIEMRKEFAVHLVTEELLAAMNISGAEFPPDESEFAAAQLHTAPSVQIGVPRMAEASVCLECRLENSMALGPSTLYVGRVVMFHVADGLVGPRLHINGFAPIGRLGAPSQYCRTTDRFELPRLSYGEAVTQGKTQGS
jgi:flavin reductase (DIM6/NTAB) family NADH-FMN oxidoreductase RutF